jgi:hypothetical protein
MINDKQLLPVSQNPCPHCATPLEPASDNGMLEVCSGCSCLFFQGMVVSYKRCNPRGPAHGAADQEG